MYFNSTLFLLRHSQPFSKSFPFFLVIPFFSRHSRAGGNLTESTAKYPEGTAASVPGTGDSCLRRSDGRDESCGSDVVK